MPEQLELLRDTFLPTRTIGTLYVEGLRLCDILEDRIREVKVKGETAIPDGVYEVIFDFSPKFGKFMPHILGVPGFTGIRFHSGVDEDDTEGCLITGQRADRDGDGVVDHVTGSRVAYADFCEHLRRLVKTGRVWLKVTTAPGSQRLAR